jgi:hypothetical protein
MAETERQLQTVRGFEADLRSGELRKAGVRLKFGIPSVFVTSVNGLSRMCSFSAADSWARRRWVQTGLHLIFGAWHQCR